MNFDHTATVAAGAGTTVLKAAGGRLRSVLVTAAGSGSGDVVFYDEAQAAGTVIGLIPATVDIDTFTTFEMPAAIGITCVSVANGPALTVSLA